MQMTHVPGTRAHIFVRQTHPKHTDLLPFAYEHGTEILASELSWLERQMLDEIFLDPKNRHLLATQAHLLSESEKFVHWSPDAGVDLVDSLHKFIASQSAIYYYVFAWTLKNYTSRWEIADRLESAFPDRKPCPCGCRV